MGEWFSTTASSGSLVLAVPVALIAGLVSFFSPCVIPLLPGYLSYATGLSGADLADPDARSSRLRMVTGSALFVLGFAVIFVLLGAAFGAVGLWLVVHQQTLQWVLGSVTILLGLAFLGAFPLLQREVRFHGVPSVGLAAAPVLGALFGLGWVPCIGPTLAAILTLSIQEATPGRGAFLAGIYALGLGLPFIVTGIAYQRALRAFSVVRRHQRLVMRAGGVMLIVVGVLVVSGLWDTLVSYIQIYLVGSYVTSV